MNQEELYERYIKTLQYTINKVKDENKSIKLANKILAVVVIILLCLLLVTSIFFINFISPNDVFDFIDTSMYTSYDENMSQFVMNYTENTYGITSADKLSRWIDNKFRYIQTNKQRKASQIYYDRYGVCKDYALLLVSFMKVMGYDARIVTYDHHAIVKVYRGNNEYFYCDPTNGNPFSDKCYDYSQCSLNEVCKEGHCINKKSRTYCWYPY